MLGGSIVSSLSSEADVAKALSVRYSPITHLGISLTYLDEGRLQAGDVGIGHRAGLSPQVWLQGTLAAPFRWGQPLVRILRQRRCTHEMEKKRQWYQP
jgi:hypothetical protein